MEYCKLTIFIVGIVCLQASLCVPLTASENSTQTVDEQDLSAFLLRLQRLANNNASGLPEVVQETTVNTPTRSQADTNSTDTNSTTNSAPTDRELLEFLEKLNKTVSNFYAQENKKLNETLAQLQTNPPELEQISSTTQNTNDEANDADILAFIDKLKKLTNESNQDQGDENKFDTAANEVNTVQSSTQEAETSSGDTSRVSLTRMIAQTDDSIIIVLAALSVFLVLVLATVAVWLVLRKCRSRQRQKMMLNKDFNRWDPQLLRPSQKSIDDFIFGTPIPSVSEMIKQ